jgi:hypothetical protein
MLVNGEGFHYHNFFKIILNYQFFKLENTIKSQTGGLVDPIPSGVDMFADDTIVTSNDNHALVQQIIELRRKLEDEQQSYKRKLQHYYDSQQRQGQLVQKLQQKVCFKLLVGCKIYCFFFLLRFFNIRVNVANLRHLLKARTLNWIEFEHKINMVSRVTTILVHRMMSSRLSYVWRKSNKSKFVLILDLIGYLFFFCARNSNVNHINVTLKEQLDQATLANQKLSQDVQKMHHEWVRLREQLEKREKEWRNEENVKKICCFFIINSIPSFLVLVLVIQ